MGSTAAAAAAAADRAHLGHAAQEDGAQRDDLRPLVVAAAGEGRVRQVVSTPVQGFEAGNLLPPGHRPCHLLRTAAASGPLPPRVPAHT